MLAIVWVLAWAASSGRLEATEVVLKDDRIIKGRMGEVGGLNEMPAAAGSEKAQPVLLIDDGLRRTFVPKRQLKEVRPGQTESQEKFLLPQQVMRNGATVKAVGPIIRITPFDQYGRRMFTMNTSRGPANVVQCITELTPTWAKVEGRTHVWDMRLATSSIPPADLAAILNHLVKAGSIDDRKRVAQFYLQSDRYEDAGKELEKLLAEHPEDSKLKMELAPTIQMIQQLSKQRLLAELEQRRAAGQHEMVLRYLKAFPADGPSAETLQAVRQLTRDYEKQSAAKEQVLKQFTAMLEKLSDKKLRERFTAVREELDRDLTPNTLPRLAAFRESLDDDAIPAEDRLALATSGWLLGNGAASSQFSLSVSLIEVRSLVRRYLNTPDKMGRDRVFSQLQSQQAASPAMVAKLLAAMKPPVEPPAASQSVPGFYELEVPGLTDQPPVRYCVQTPPEYDPLRRYPTIVTLNGAGSAPEQQIDYWAGGATKNGRLGQATRQGYIVVAPAWRTEHQKEYDYTLREHAAVLDVLRDACRRFAIDTDRVFLSGHSIGGDAAWDIALAHPDLWAGVIPIVAKADRYCTFYTKNAATLPMYFVAGELDSGRTVPNATEWDDYMNRGYNVTIVHFLGRGHENFSDEILRLFDWMSRFRRNFFPQRFETRSMRPWDNFFWWIELKDLPEQSIVLPDHDQWQSRGAQSVPAKSTQAAQTKATCSGNSLHVGTGAHNVTIWLSPEFVDFNKRLSISVNARNLSGTNQIEAQLSTLLEDVRTRGDRQHPFWAKIETPTGRVNR